MWECPGSRSGNRSSFLKIVLRNGQETGRSNQTERTRKKMKEIDPSKPPFHWCPRFERCSANRCPFDPEIGKKGTLRGEERCRLAKSRRMRLWDTLPEEKK